MARYLDIDGLKLETVLPSSYVDDVEAMEPGWLDRQIVSRGRWIDAQLSKRYATPFAAFDAAEPTPSAVQGWVARLIAPLIMFKRGVDQSDAQFDLIREDADEAKAEIQAAADAEEGLWELPLRDGGPSGVRRGATRSYSERSPFVHTDVQRRVAFHEDQAGEGSYG